MNNTEALLRAALHALNLKPRFQLYQPDAPRTSYELAALIEAELKTREAEAAAREKNELVASMQSLSALHSVIAEHFLPMDDKRLQDAATHGISVTFIGLKDFHADPPPVVVAAFDHIDAEDENELVTRTAPRWAWDTVDETLEMDANSNAFSSELRAEIQLAIHGMNYTAEAEGWGTATREQVAEWGGVA